MNFTLLMLKRFKWVAKLGWVSSINKPAIYLAIFAFVFFSTGISYSFASDITPQKVVDMANADRKNKEISELVENEKLSRSAMSKAQDMITDNYFSHNAPNGTTPWRWIEKENYDYNYAGENLAMDFSSVEKMNEAWLASPTHRANILNEKYKDIGVAVQEGIINGHSTIVVVQMFGSGDKKANQEESTDELQIKREKISETENYIPALPAGEARYEKIAFKETLIYWPRQGEVINGREIEIVGRAEPGSRVNLFDNETDLGDSIADEQGWFRSKKTGVFEGSHTLLARPELINNLKNESELSGKITFYVDRTSPEIRYNLHADRGSDSYLIEIYANERNCFFELGGEALAGIFHNPAVFPVSAKRASVVASVSDKAGNRTKKQIELVNFYAGDHNQDFVGNFANSFLPKTAYAADSGRKAFVKNLGLVPHHFSR